MGTVAAKASNARRRSPVAAVPRPNRVEHGAIFTKRWVVELVLDLAGYSADRPLGELVAIEPACGDGAFLVPMVERLSDACEREGRGLLDALGAIRAYDLQAKHVRTSREAVIGTLTARGWRPKHALQFAEHAVRKGDFLLARSLPKADFVVGNPPYIRLESVPAKRSDAYRRSCETMGGRADIYVGFFEIGLRSLVDGGVLSFICADRWMRNQYGRFLRQLVADGFDMEAVVEMHTVDAFDTEVSAYPAVTAIRKGPQGPALVAEATNGFGPAEARELVRWGASAKREDELRTEALRAAVLPGWFEGPGSWPGGPPGRLAAVKDLESRFPTLEDEATGTRVGIGVATGADRVFVTTDAAAVEPDRLLPLAMAYDTMEGRLRWSQHYLVDPWRSDGGGLVELSEFPRLRD
jgi:adenine-specific DNA-methyltransferase